MFVSPPDLLSKVIRLVYRTTFVPIVSLHVSFSIIIMTGLWTLQHTPKKETQIYLSILFSFGGYNIPSPQKRIEHPATRWGVVSVVNPLPWLIPSYSTTPSYILSLFSSLIYFFLPFWPESNNNIYLHSCVPLIEFFRKGVNKNKRDIHKKCVAHVFNAQFQLIAGG